MGSAFETGQIAEGFPFGVCSAGEAKQKARGAAAANAEPGLPAHTERGFPPREEGGPAQPGRAASALADPPLAPQAPQPGSSAAPTKQEGMASFPEYPHPSHAVA